MNQKAVLWGVILKGEKWGLGIGRGGKTDGKEKGRLCTAALGKIREDEGKSYLSLRREEGRLVALSLGEMLTSADLSNRIQRPFRKGRALTISSAEHNRGYINAFFAYCG